MRRRLLAVSIVFYSLMCGAVANKAQCESLHDLKNPNPNLCICTESLSKLPITIPDGFTLTGACNYHKPYGADVIGNYTFRGNVTISGKISSGADFDSEADSYYLYFYDDRKIPFSQFRSATASLRFRNEEIAAKQFKVPKLTHTSNCWQAPATITVSVLVVEEGYGTDTEGTYAEEFKVLRVGKYSRCKYGAP